MESPGADSGITRTQRTLCGNARFFPHSRGTDGTTVASCDMQPSGHSAGRSRVCAVVGPATHPRMHRYRSAAVSSLPTGPCGLTTERSPLDCECRTVVVNTVSSAACAQGKSYADEFIPALARKASGVGRRQLSTAKSYIFSQWPYPARFSPGKTDMRMGYTVRTDASYRMTQYVMYNLTDHTVRVWP